MTNMIRAVWRYYGDRAVRTATSDHATMRDALTWLGDCQYVSGPNGPLTTRSVITPQGERRDLFALAEEHGLEPLTRDHLSTEIFAGVR